MSTIGISSTPSPYLWDSSPYVTYYPGAYFTNFRPNFSLRYCFEPLGIYIGLKKRKILTPDPVLENLYPRLKNLSKAQVILIKNFNLG